jgi:hypothetical protein
MASALYSCLPTATAPRHLTQAKPLFLDFLRYNSSPKAPIVSSGRGQIFPWRSGSITQDLHRQAALAVRARIDRSHPLGYSACL